MKPTTLVFNAMDFFYYSDKIVDHNNVIRFPYVLLFKDIGVDQT